MKKKFLMFLICSLLMISIPVMAETNTKKLWIDNPNDSSVKFNYSQDDTCSGIFGDINNKDSLLYMISKYVYIPLKVIVPLLLLVLTTFDFSKVVFSDSKDGMDKAKKNFVKRSIIAIIIFFIPAILNIVFEFVDNQSVRSCVSELNK